MGALIRFDSSDVQEREQQLAEIEAALNDIARKLGILGYPKRQPVLKSSRSLEFSIDYLDYIRFNLLKG